MNESVKLLFHGPSKVVENLVSGPSTVLSTTVHVRMMVFLWILPKKISFGRKVKGNLSQMKNGSYTYTCVELKCMLYEHGEIVLWPFMSTPPRTPHCILSKENIISIFF